MTVELETAWSLRSVMASRGIFQTSKLKPLLEERGVTSRCVVENLDIVRDQLC